MLIVEALQADRGNVWYVAPTQGQARDIMWLTLLELGNPVIESCRFDGEARQRYALDRKHHHVDHNGRQAVGLHNLTWTDSLDEAMRVMQTDMASTI